MANPDDGTKGSAAESKDVQLGRAEYAPQLIQLTGNQTVKKQLPIGYVLLSSFGVWVQSETEPYTSNVELESRGV